MINPRGMALSSDPGTPHEAVLAQLIMAKNKGTKGTIKKDWESGSGFEGALFRPEELDIYVNKATSEAYIFHGKKIDYTALANLEYDPDDNSVTVVQKDGKRLDLGVKIQWLVRPYFVKAQQVNVVQTKDGKSIDGVVLPLIHKQKSAKK
jgi:hypothetical protein